MQLHMSQGIAGYTMWTINMHISDKNKVYDVGWVRTKRWD